MKPNYQEYVKKLMDIIEKIPCSNRMGDHGKHCKCAACRGKCLCPGCGARKQAIDVVANAWSDK